MWREHGEHVVIIVFAFNLSFFFWQKATTGTHFFITVCSNRSILFCTRTVGISPTSASTFSFQLSMAWNESLSVVEKTNTHAWAPGMQDVYVKRSHFHSYFTQLKKKNTKYKIRERADAFKTFNQMRFLLRACVRASTKGWTNTMRRSVR